MAYERLTDQDIERLVSVLLDLTAKHPKQPFFQRFIQAQEKVLPASKRYSRSVVQQRTKWSRKLQAALKGAGLWPGYVPPTEESKEESPAPVSVPAPVPVQPPAESVSLITSKPVPEPAAPQLPVLAQKGHPSELIAQLYSSIKEDLKSDLTTEMSTQIEQQVRLQLRAAILTAEELENIGDIVSQPQLKEMAERTETLVSIPRVFVVGLLPEQTLILRRKLHGVPIDLRFWKNEANTKLTEYAMWADLIFIMSKFVSHSHIHTITGRARDKVRYCNGAVSDLERQVRFSLTETVS